MVCTVLYGVYSTVWCVQYCDVLYHFVQYSACNRLQETSVVTALPPWPYYVLVPDCRRLVTCDLRIVTCDLWLVTACFG